MTADTMHPTQQAEPSHCNRSVRYCSATARILMGLLFFIAGLNGLVHFLPQSKTPPPPEAAAFIGAMMKTGYFLYLVAGTQFLAGVLLLANRFVPLALVLIAPVIVNILAFHIFLARSGLPIACVVTILELYLIWAYRKAFRPMLAIYAKPGADWMARAMAP